MVRRHAVCAVVLFALVVGLRGAGAETRAGRVGRPGRPGRIDLSLRRLPIVVPSSLVMRLRRAAAQSQPASRPAPPRRASPLSAPLAPRAGGAAVRADARGELAAPGRRLDEKVVFRLNLGYGIDGGQPSGSPLLSGAMLDEEVTYARLRSYGFGDLVLGTRGLVFPSFSTYVAGEFRFDQGISQATQAIPTVYDEDQLLIRSAYAESQGLFRTSWLRPIYLRAGRQFKYGVTVAHFDGLTVGFDTSAVSGSIWFGQRVSLYSSVARDEFFGTSARFDLSSKPGIPVILSIDSLRAGESDHWEYGVSYRWKPDILIRGSVRQLDSEVARETVSVWARLSEVTTLTAEIDNRTADDWIYDLVVQRRPDERGDVRNYLNLGPPLPRVQFDVRAGTVVLRNLDILLRAAAAIEHADGAQDGPFSPTYVEAGAAFEVRLRRDLRLGSSFLARRYRLSSAPEVDDTAGVPDPLAELDNEIGESSFYEGGLGIDYSVGARRFNAAGELYGRLYRRESPYEKPATVQDPDLRTGGRFSVEGWASNRLRIKAEYDISLSDIDLAPELRGVKTLRVLADGTY